MKNGLIIGLAVSLVGALLTIAFLVGRMTGASSAPPRDPAPFEDGTRRDPTQPATLNEGRPGGPTFGETQPTLPPRFAPLTTRPARADGQQTSRERTDTAEIASYFTKMDAIQVAGAGDPTAFAQGILFGLETGATSGIDKLVDDAKRALARAAAVQPPSACADYHRHLIEALSEAVAQMVKMRDAIARSDLDSLAALAQQVQATQQKTDDLERMKKQLLGR